MLDTVTSLTSTLSFSSPRFLSSVMPPNTEKHDSITVNEPRELSGTQVPILSSALAAVEVFSHNRLSSMHIASAIHYQKVSDQSKRGRSVSHRTLEVKKIGRSISVVSLLAVKHRALLGILWENVELRATQSDALSQCSRPERRSVAMLKTPRHVTHQNYR